MSDRMYRLILGALLLMALYFDLKYLVYALTAILLLEGITNWRIPLLIRKLRNDSTTTPETDANLSPIQGKHRCDFEAERAFRLTFGLMLLVTYVLFFAQLWFFPWFMGFATFGAGASGVCPMLTALKWVGCR